VQKRASSSSFVAKVKGLGDDLLPEDPVPAPHGIARAVPIGHTHADLRGTDDRE